MSHFDVFNGDADGLCALQQLRLVEPRGGVLITGVKRDNALLARVPAVGGDSVTVLDLSLDTNRNALLALLQRGVHVQYFDHHRPGEIPVHSHFEAVIDTSAEVCTSVLVDRHLGGRYRAWAVVGAFGDALTATATGLAASLQLGPEDLERLRSLGECLNYNSYGDSAADQMYRPEALYHLLQPYDDPLEFMVAESAYSNLARQYAEDIERTERLHPLAEAGSAAVYQLPDAAWARRVVGSFANRLATRPGCAHVVLQPNSCGTFTVSLRVTAGTAVSADTFVRRYGGDGRLTAAGIGNLPAEAVAGLAADFLATYRSL